MLEIDPLTCDFDGLDLQSLSNTDLRVVIARLLGYVFKPVVIEVEHTIWEDTCDYILLRAGSHSHWIIVDPSGKEINPVSDVLEWGKVCESARAAAGVLPNWPVDINETMTLVQGATIFCNRKKHAAWFVTLLWGDAVDEQTVAHDMSLTRAMCLAWTSWKLKM